MLHVHIYVIPNLNYWIRVTIFILMTVKKHFIYTSTNLHIDHAVSGFAIFAQDNSYPCSLKSLINEFFRNDQVSYLLNMCIRWILFLLIYQCVAGDIKYRRLCISYRSFDHLICLTNSLKMTHLKTDEMDERISNDTWENLEGCKNEIVPWSVLLDEWVLLRKEINGFVYERPSSGYRIMMR